MEQKPLTVEDIDKILLEDTLHESENAPETEIAPVKDEVKCGFCKSANVKFIRLSEVEEHFHCSDCKREFSFLRRDILT